ncbi:MAG: FKBP-type peptidyl-prolyl cis-trans isomerase [Bacteroidales bacterium]|nr:FKBP-type peptidyl-prolyl cis-trans isomerase [Bacteroidales bacterium]
MKKIIVSFLFVAAAIAFAGCARQAAVGANDANKRYFDAWMMLNHPKATATDLGVYILENNPADGNGAIVEKDGYALLEYTITDLEGNIVGYTTEEAAKQLGTYDKTAYYGGKFVTTADGTLYAGLQNVLVGMKVGDSRKVAIPSWLMSYSTYETEKKYLEESSSAESSIYEFTVKDFAEDIFDWQVDKIGEYFEAHPTEFAGMTVADSLKNFKGFYYKTIVPAPDTDTTAFKTDTTIYINYTGRLIDGTVFDTTDERLAKDSGIWSSTRTYAPVSIKWGESYSDITMSSSTVITGFALTLWQMRAFESGIGVFTSNYGYGYSGSGESIPGYSPLVFEIEIVKKPEE